MNIRYIVWSFVFVLVLGIMLFQLRYFLGGPRIDYENQYMLTEVSPIRIVFMVHNTKRLEINGRAVIPEIGGRVDIELPVQVGYNTVTLDVWDNFGRHKQEYLYIAYPHIAKNPD